MGGICGLYEEEKEESSLMFSLFVVVILLPCMFVNGCERDSNAVTSTRGGTDRRGEEGGSWYDAEESSVGGELPTGTLVTPR